MTGSRAQCTAGARCQPRDLREAIDCLAHHSSNPLRVIAERLGKDLNYLRKATSQYDDAHPLRADLVVPLTIASADLPGDRNLVALELMARQAGGAFIVLPPVRADLSDDMRHASDAMHEFAQTMQAYAAALANGEIDAHELDAIRREGNEAIEAILRLVDHAGRRAAPAVKTEVRR